MYAKDLTPGPHDQSIAGLLQCAEAHGIDSAEALALAQQYAIRDGTNYVLISQAAEATQTLTRRRINLGF